MRFITGLLVTGLLSSSVFKVGAVAPKSEVNDTIVDLRPLVYEQPFQRKGFIIAFIWSTHMSRIFNGIDNRSHYSHGKSIGDQHTSPRTATFHTESFQS